MMLKLIILVINCVILTKSEYSYTRQNIDDRNVIIPPLIVKQPPKIVSFKKYESFELDCEAVGTAPIIYKWNFNGKIFDPSGLDDRVVIQPGIGTLIFTRPLKRDEGTYQCFASNSAGVSLSVVVDSRLAILESFIQQSETIHNVRLGHPLKLDCIPPKSFPIAFIYWVKELQESGITIPVETSDRISLDPEGNLHFSNAVSKDYNNGGFYSCVAQNDVTRTQQVGRRHYIHPNGKIVELMKPLIQWQMASHHIVLYGESIKLTCMFSGSPTPTVQWFLNKKYDFLESPRFKTENYGRELIISNVKFEDSNTYECVGTNSQSPTGIHRSVKLKVESQPYWQEKGKPESVEVSESDSAVFVCKALGLPKPVVNWYINGKAIGVLKNNEKRIIKEDVITFKNINKLDVGVIQCNATNKHGYVFANAYLNVLEEAPSILEHPKKLTIMSEQMNARINCLVVGTPQPIVTWNKGDEQLTGGRFLIDLKGHLSISKVFFVDSGLYTCNAYNKFGNTSSSGRLEVIRRTHIITKPRDIVIIRGSEAKFTCTATTDLNRISNLKIDWMKDGELFDYKDFDRVYKNEQDNSLTISGTIIHDTGRYSCYASNGIDSDVADANLIVQARPEPPIKVRSECFETHNQAKVRWSAGRVNYSPIINFIVEYNTSFTPDRWITAKRYVPSSIRQILVNLSPWNNYTFRVMAQNKIGVSLPSRASPKTCRTNIGRPKRNPKNVIVQGDLPDNLVIYWTPMLQSEHGGSKFRYLLKWKKANTTDQVIPKMWNTYEIMNWTYNHYTIKEVFKTYKPYVVQVIAKNEFGIAEEDAKIIRGYSGEGKPKVSVSNLNYNKTTLSANSVNLLWNDPIINDETIRGYFRGYLIQYWTENMHKDIVQEVEYIINEDIYAPRIRLPRQVSLLYNRTGETRKFYLSGLPSFTKIYVHIRIMNKFYVGPASNLLSIHTREGVPNRVSSFVYNKRGPTFIQVSWIISDNTLDQTIVGFKISFQIVSKEKIEQKIFVSNNLPADANTFRIHGLIPEKKYRITIFAFNILGMGKGAYIEASTTPATIPDPPVFTIEEIRSTSVSFLYESDQYSENPGSVFYVQYKRLGEYSWKKTFEQSDSIGTIRIITLDVNTPYEFRFVSRNSMDFVGFSEIIAIQTNDHEGFFYPIFYRTVWFWMSIIIIFVLIFIASFVIYYFKIRHIRWYTTKDTLADKVRKMEAQEAVKRMGFAGTSQSVNM
ncbi:Neuronal cell adhesion molecule [Intoshia linei]|uniref:Neuronal cell adhesion molecule n=1 Tax=Intoshia linei TaxID=1819745 RepID=A0A177BEH6_9BILA|nr:Neuronal cell adhesion molecule [Intoshia linei]